MVAISGSPWAIRLIFAGISCNLLLWWYLLSAPRLTEAVEQPGPAAPLTPVEPEAEKETFPTFNSWSNFEVISPRNPKTWPFRKFRSSPHNPPHMTIATNGREQSRGYVFLSPRSAGGEKGVKQAASFIMRGDGEMVYAHVEAAHDTDGLRVQSFNSEEYLTLWRGVHKTGHGFGEVVLIDSEYERTTVNLDAVIENVFGQKFPGKLDFHEQQLTARGTILVTAYNTTVANLSAVGGPEVGYVSDSMFFEIDVETHDILFSWSALDYFEIEDSMLPITSSMGSGADRSPYDFFHLNSIQPIGHDSFLISSRNFWSVYLISRTDGRVLWELKGNSKGGSFGPLPLHGQFRWQNHVRAFNATSKGLIISMFDNHNSPEDSGRIPSRGLLLKLKLPPSELDKPKVLRTLQPDVARFSNDYGSYQVGLSGNNQLLSYGDGAVVHEFGPGDGTDLRWEARFGHDGAAETYRAFKAEWHATPRLWSPALVIERPGESVVGYVTWNGVTDVEAWNVYVIEPGVAMRPLGKAVANGFETAFDLPRSFDEAHCVMVAAVKEGLEVRQSNTACMEGRKFVSGIVDEEKEEETGDAKGGAMQKVLGSLS
ncbi:hypothetical protein ACJ41O_006724 [Fusarium nematophilum]